MAINEALKERFPFLIPVDKPPSLRTVNGIGFKIYGNRNGDQETGTFVTTYFFVVFFIPVFALRSYRVANAKPSGWYFLGKEPVSSFVLKYNMGVAAVIAILAGIAAFQ